MLRKGPVADGGGKLQADDKVAGWSRFAVYDAGAGTQVADERAYVEALVEWERPTRDYPRAVQANVFGDALLRGGADFQGGQIHGHAERGAVF